MHLGQILGRFPACGCTQQAVSWIDTFIELGHVGINVILGNLAVRLADVINKITNGDIVKAFVRVIEFGVIYGLDGVCCKVYSNAMDVLEGSPCLLGFFVFGTELFMLCG